MFFDGYGHGIGCNILDSVLQKALTVGIQMVESSLAF